MTLHADPQLPQPRDTVLTLVPYVPGTRPTSAATAALASNEGHFAPLPSVFDAVATSARQLNRYPDTGAPILRERIAAHAGVSVAEIAVGAGSLGVLEQIITSLCDPGDEIVFAWRSFEAYPVLATLGCAVPVAVPLASDEGHDLAAMAAAITERTRIVVLCTPNNPTGVPIPGAAIERFLSGVPSRVLVVIDEAYLEYDTSADPVDAVAIYRAHPNVCVLRTFSKAHGLAGLRVGYAIARPHIADGLRRSGLPFAVSMLAQDAAIASLDAEDQVRERVALVTAERERVATAARGLGWAIPDSQANFIWIRVDDPGREQLLAAFSEADIIVRGYPGDGVRITLADAVTNDRVLAVLASVAGRLPS